MRGTKRISYPLKELKEGYLNFILKHVSTVTGVPIEFIKGKIRIRDYVLARQYYCYLAKTHYNKYDFSLSEIGRVINNDHATALHGKKEIENKLSIKDKRVTRDVELLLAKNIEKTVKYELLYEKFCLKDLLKQNRTLQLNIIKESITI